jgi:hypothetical protein
VGLNATDLFRKPSNEFHNSEGFWTAYFALFLVWESQSPTAREIPVYSCDLRGHFASQGLLPVSGLAFCDVVVDGVFHGKLGDEPFRLKTESPNDLQNLKIDVALLRREQKTVDLIEVKTIGGDVMRNVERYPRVCQTLEEAGWNASLYYLLSHGHERTADFKPLARAKSRIILWEDILNLAAETPLGKMLAGVPISSFATMPEACNCDEK